MKKYLQRWCFKQYAPMLLSVIMLFIFNPSRAQETNKVSGTVTNATGQPLQGASISIKGLSKTTVSDANGKFSIAASKGAVLVISFVDFENKEIKIIGIAPITISLTVKNEALDDVVVVAYGTVKKKDLTGAVSIVNVAEARKTASYDVAKMLQGQVPGVTVQGSGEPGGYVSIKIRGISSLSAGSDPLFVIDGVPVTAPFDFSPDDIESIQVLKDASSAALYGSRANGGVVIITTKKGRAGALKLGYNAYVGLQNVPKKIPVTNRLGYQTITNAAESNAGLSLAPGNDPTSSSYINKVNTDWQKEAFTTGVIQDHHLNVSGGNEFTTYNASLGYFDQTSTYKGPQKYNRYTINTNLQGKKGIFSYGVKLAYTQSHKVNPYNGMQYHAVFGGAVTSVLTAIPTMPVYDANRLRGFGGSDNATQRAITLNVVGMNSVLQDYSDRNRLLAGAWAEIEPVKNLKYRINLSYDRTDWNNFHFEPTFDLGWYYLNTQAFMATGTGHGSSALIENTLSYQLKYKQHKLDLLAGMTFQDDKDASYFATGTGFTEPYFYSYSTLDAANKSTTDYYSQHALTSILGRLNYNYSDKYLLTINGRRDNSSNFSPLNHFAYFGSVAAAWNIHNEKFIHLPEVISSLKLRGGYGTLGNENIPRYAYQSVVNASASYLFGNTLAPGTITKQLIDPNIKWETTISTTAAIEVGLLKERLKFTAEYYKRKSIDMLYNAAVPLSTGSFPSTILTNIAELENHGFEFTLAYRDNDHKLHYDISANMHTLQNKLLKITGQQNDHIDGAGSRSEVGRSIGDIYAYQTLGIFQSAAEVLASPAQSGAAAGDIKFKDVDGNNIINGDDRTYLGTAIPKIYYGLNVNLSYGNWDFSMFWQGNAGNKVLNGVYHDLMGEQYSNHHIDALNFWSTTNTNTDVPRPIIGDPNANNRFSNRHIESGTYVKLQNCQLGYSLSDAAVKKLKVIKTFRAYISGQNLITVSSYRGYDPDFLSDGLFSRGFDIGSFPNPRSFMLGVQVGF